VQAEFAPVEVTVPVHAAARQELAGARVRPLMIRAHDARHLSGFLLTDAHPSVTARVVEGSDRPVVPPDDDDGIGVDVEHEVVARPLHLAAVAGEEPAPAPDALEVEQIDARIRLELAGEGVTGLVRGDQAIELGLRVGNPRHCSEPIIARRTRAARRLRARRSLA